MKTLPDEYFTLYIPVLAPYDDEFSSSFCKFIVDKPFLEHLLNIKDTVFKNGFSEATLGTSASFEFPQNNECGFELHNMHVTPVAFHFSGKAPFVNGDIMTLPIIIEQLFKAFDGSSGEEAQYWQSQSGNVLLICPPAAREVFLRQLRESGERVPEFL